MLLWGHYSCNSVFFVQWIHKKVANFISTMGVSVITEIKMTVGPEKLTMNCELVIKSYTANMGKDY